MYRSSNAGNNTHSKSNKCSLPVTLMVPILANVADLNLVFNDIALIFFNITFSLMLKVFTEKNMLSSNPNIEETQKTNKY